MDDLQRFLRVQLEDPEAAATADWLREIRAADERHDDFLADELELVIELSAVKLFWWNALTALAAAQHDLKPQQQAVLPASFYSWCVGVAAGALKPPVVRGRPRPFWRDVYIVAAIATYRRRKMSLSRSYELVAAVCGLSLQSVERIWLDRWTLELPVMSATVAQQLAELLG